MRALALSCLVFTVACSPGAPRETHTPDPALGVHLLRVAGSVPTTGGLIELKTNLSRPTSDGAVFVYAQHSARREFSSPDLDGGETFLFLVHPDDSVDELPPPPTGALIPGAQDIVAAARTDRPAVIVDRGPAGHAAAIYLFDGDAWLQRPLLLSNLAAEGVQQTAFNAVRIVDETRVIFRVGLDLLVLDGERYRKIPTPEGAVELGLGPVGSDGVRLLWTDATGRLFTASYDLDWALGEVAVSSRAGLTLDGSRTSGDPDSFTLDLDDTTGRVSLFFHEGGFTEAGPVPFDRDLFQTPHPTRAFRSTPFGNLSLEFDSAFAGVAGEPIGAVDFREPISCVADPCEAVAGGLLDGSSCRVCAPRQALVRFVSPLPDVDGLFLLIEDHFNGGTSLYLRRARFPFGDNLLETDSPVPDFPGETPLEPPPDQLLVNVTALRVGLDDHTGVNVSILTSAGTVVESGQTDAAGFFAFPPLASADGPFTLDVDGVIQQPVGRDEGIADIGPLVVEGTLEPASFTPAFETIATTPYGLVQRDGARLLYAGSELTADLRAGAEVLTFRRHGNLFRPIDIYFNEGDCASACPLVLVQGLEGNVDQTVQLSPHFPIERLQLASNNSGFNNPLPVYADLSAGLNPTWVRRLADGTEAPLQAAEHLLFEGAGLAHIRWFDNGDGTEQVFSYNAQGTEFDHGVDAIPRLFRPLSMSLGVNQNVAFTAEGCGAPPFPSCTAWRLNFSQTAELHPRAHFALDNFQILIEDDESNLDFVDIANINTVRTGDVDVLLDVPAGQTPATTVGGRKFFRGAAGLYDQVSALLLAGADRLVRVDQQLSLVWVGDDLHRIVVTNTQLLQAGVGRVWLRGNNGELVYDETWTGCPGGPCDVIWRMPIGGTPTPIARGSLYLDRAIDVVPFDDDTTFVLDKDGQPALLP
jgi:hypothetical protein